MTLLANKAFLPSRPMPCPPKGKHSGCWQRYGERSVKTPNCAIWFLPTGDAMEQAGERRTDLLLAWAADDTISLDHARIREKWPDCQEIRVLAKNLFLVVGVKLPVSARVAPSVPHEITPCALATRLLAEARQQGELSSEVAALLDMGIVVRREGNAGRAATLLEQALELARRRGNAAQEMDVLSNLGPAYLSLGNARQC